MKDELFYSAFIIPHSSSAFDLDLPHVLGQLRPPDLDGEELPDDLDVGRRVGRERAGGVGAAARERQRYQELIREVLADGGADVEVALRLPDGARRDHFGAHAALADAGEDLGQVLALDLDGEH